MKKCPFCAEEIQDEAIVCRFCNRDLAGKVEYEYCEIVFEKKMGIIFMKSRLWAKATGPKGVYVAASEENWRNGLPYDPAARKGTQIACDKMIIDLQKDGWELLPYQGSSFFSYKFQRPVK